MKTVFALKNQNVQVIYIFFDKIVKMAIIYVFFIEVLGCAAGEIYSKCGGLLCGPTCDNPLATPCPCTQGGCTCRYSYVRVTSGGFCVPQTMCNTTTS